LTKADLIEDLSNEAGLTRRKGKEIVKVFFDEISNALTNKVWA
jgi:nucleoid DNA-binding protein